MTEFTKPESYVEVCLGSDTWKAVLELERVETVVEILDINRLAQLFNIVENLGYVNSYEQLNEYYQYSSIDEVNRSDLLNRFSTRGLVYTGPHIVSAILTGLPRGTLDVYPIDTTPDRMLGILINVGGPGNSFEEKVTDNDDIFSFNCGSYLTKYDYRPNADPIDVHLGKFKSIASVLYSDNIGMGIGIFYGRVYATIRCIYQMVNRVIMLEPKFYNSKYPLNVANYMKLGFRIFYQPNNELGPIVVVNVGSNRSVMGRIHNEVIAMHGIIGCQLLGSNIRQLDRDLSAAQVEELISHHYLRKTGMVVSALDVPWFLENEVIQDSEVCKRDIQLEQELNAFIDLGSSAYGSPLSSMIVSIDSSLFNSDLIVMRANTVPLSLVRLRRLR